jgi:hypothetical protein
MKKLFAVAALAPLSAFAAVPTAVESAVTSIGADATSIATTVLVAVVTVFALKFIRKGL